MALTRVRSFRHDKNKTTDNTLARARGNIRKKVFRRFLGDDRLHTTSEVCDVIAAIHRNRSLRRIYHHRYNPRVSYL